MHSQIRGFLDELDRELAIVANGEQLDLYVVGRSAINARFGTSLQTADFDVLTNSSRSKLLEKAIHIAGKESEFAKRHQLYLEDLNSALPPMAGNFKERASVYRTTWSVVRLYFLDPHDLIISKLGRFGLKDQQDIRQICDLSSIDSERLSTLHESAVWMLNHPGTDDYQERQHRLQITLNYLETGVWQTL